MKKIFLAWLAAPLLLVSGLSQADAEYVTVNMEIDIDRSAEFYNLYHGFMEARPTGANSSKLLYTLILDVSNLADQAARDADITRRRATFERALGNMKALTEE